MIESNHYIISHARWLTPKGYFEEGHIEIEGGKIAQLGRSLLSSKNLPTISAKGYVLLPGIIDPHVHFREPGQMYKEGIRNASRAALKGGVTTIIDMPNNKPPVTNLKRVHQKRKRFENKALVNWGIMLQATANPQSEVHSWIKSVKIYMARSSALAAITEESTLRKLFSTYRQVSIHAEDETLFLKEKSKNLPHHEWRPRTAIKVALNKIENALKSLEIKQRPRVIICHVNTRDEVLWLKRMKKEGFDVWGETCPHYLYFTQDDYLQKGAVLQVNPPLRTRQDQQAILEGLSDGTIDFIATDHAPHLPEEKQSDHPPSGIAAIEWLYPQILHLIDEGIIKWAQLNDLVSKAAAECYQIKDRNGIEEGNWADLVMVRRCPQKRSETNIITRAAINPYQQFDFRWAVEATIVNGIVKYQQGKFINDTKGMAI